MTSVKMDSDMVSTKDLALVGGLGILVFLVTKAGRDLFGALPALAEGVSDFGSSVSDSIGGAGEGLQDFFSNVFNIGDANAQTPPVIIGNIEDRQVPTDLVPTEQERLSGNEFIRESLNLPDPVVVGVIEEIVNSPLAPTEEERIAGNSFIQNTINRLNQESRSIEDFRAQQQVPTIDTSVPSPFDNQTFRGGGSSFIGGQVNAIPIERQSLGDIIDEFGVTASQAADIRARAADDFGDFDFGTNTGRGIGSLFRQGGEIDTLVSRGNPSNPDFEGLTPTEIAQRLTGGNISNF